MSQPLVSVITPCYNDGKYICATVEAVEKSAYTNIEHIIVNDGSTDPYTIQVLDKIDSPRVRIINSDKHGVCSARNTAIKQSRGKYILPLDSDDLISSEYIALAVDHFEADDDTKVVTCNYQYFGELHRRIKVEQYSMEKLLGHNLYVVSSFFRYIDFDRVGGFNENMNDGLEDWDFWISILKLGGHVVILEGEHFFYRIKPQNLSRNRSMTADNFKKVRRRIWDNHRELYSSVFPDPLQTIEYLNITNSREYRLGKLLLAPLRNLMNTKRF